MSAPDDPRLTSYAVDELDAETAAAVEAALRDSDSARRAVSETKDAARLVTAALADEPRLELWPEQRKAVAAAARASRPGARERLVPIVLALAAALLVAVLLLRRAPVAAPVRQTVAATAQPAPLTATAPPQTQVAPPIPSATPARGAATARQSTSQRGRTKPTPPPAASTGSVELVGSVADTAGGAIQGATVTVRSVATGEERQVTTSPHGAFTLKDLAPGPLDLRAEGEGFRTATERVTGLAGQQLAWSARLDVGVVSGIEVTAVAKDPTLPPSTGVPGDAYARPDSGQQVESLSTIGRSPMELMRLLPGTVPTSNALQLAGPRAYGIALDATGPAADLGTEAYAYRADNGFAEVRQHPLSTFGLDVDTASYSNVRRFLNQGQLPPADAVRLEELINYFPYSYPGPKGDARFAASLEAGPAPWNPEHRLVRVGVKTPELDMAKRPAANLVFLIDVSGSMNTDNKLPLVKRSLGLLVEQLEARDKVAMVAYAGNAGLVLPPTPGSDKRALLAALERLQAGGSTNGGQGIQLAYDLAQHHFVEGGVNRVVLATDGDFNVGTTDEGSLVRLVKTKAEKGVFLSVLGFGMGNLKDGMLEKLADEGNGNYAYIDTVLEARKALVEQLAGTLVTVAKDVKIQVEFNPAQVQAYRLIGYENRLLRPEDFKDDKKDAGEVGAGQTVTALYEVVPAKPIASEAAVDPLRYQDEHQPKLTDAAHSGELLRLKLRYKDPQGHKSREQAWTLVERGTPLDATSEDFRFAASVATFGMVLRNAPDKAAASLELARGLAEAGRGPDVSGYRAEFVELIGKAEKLLGARRP